ncbi:AraC family transcriptional regulator [Candidatus Stoquefichus sp. SB1]|uniref:AraC family transcriptional regulator n=1 Tax=Candidatus Stoquefichus sp. SB1 TaxID=1658109 RepID=UPI00067F4377|nr:AraC family transcriptional regulator [Candidatus Stoquefichus sp. SB1]
MNYQKALEQAILYIENHLQEDIKVEDVAHFVGYSYFHLNRQFNAIIGESVGNYIKKRRLANAAHQLLYTDNKIIDIAMENNFESAEAFSRAFKFAYKVSPLNYRKNRIHTFVSSKECLNHYFMNHLLNHVTVHPRIVEIPEIKVMGLREETELKPERIKELWEKLAIMKKEFPSLPSHHRQFGIYESYQEDIHYIANEDMKCYEVVGIEVEFFDNVKPPFVRKVIPGGKYAVFTHHGSLETLSQTIDYIWGTWLLTTKEEIDFRETFELQDERFLGYHHPESEMDIYIPIR